MRNRSVNFELLALTLTASIVGGFGLILAGFSKERAVLIVLFVQAAFLPLCIAYEVWRQAEEDAEHSEGDAQASSRASSRYNAASASREEASAGRGDGDEARSTGAQLALIVNGDTVATDPNRAQLRHGLSHLLEGHSLIFRPTYPEVRLQRSAGDWISARWDRGAGITLRRRRPVTGEEFEDNVPFISLERTFYLFRNYAQGRDGWQDSVGWKPAGAYSWKWWVGRLVRGGWVGQSASVVLGLALLPAIGYVDLSLGGLWTAQGAFGMISLTLGTSMGLASLPNVAYTDEHDPTRWESPRAELGMYIGMVLLGAGVLAGALL
jgi:hypothetical protein